MPKSRKWRRHYTKAAKLKNARVPVVKYVPDLIRESADIYEARSKFYGDSYKSFGLTAAGLFPGGIVVKTAGDWNRLGVLVHMLTKLTRYANNFEAGGHDDSLVDLCTYAAMLRELDATERSK